MGDIRVEANATSELAGFASSARTSPAPAAYARAIALRQRIGDSRGLASDYNNLAGLARAAGDLDEARRQLEAALAINRRDDRPEVAATNLVNLAALASLAGDFARAEALYREALATWRVAAVGRRGGCPPRAGRTGVRRGDYPAAAPTCAMHWPSMTGPDRCRMRSRCGSSGRCQRGRGRPAGSARRPPPGPAPRRLGGSGAGVQAGLALARADLAAQLNARPEAKRLYARAELLYRRAGNRSGRPRPGRAGNAPARQGDPARAQELLHAALATELAAGNRRGASITRLWLGRLALRRGDTTGARRQLAAASAELNRLGDPVAAAAAQGERAALESAAGLPAAAESLYRAALETWGTSRARGDLAAPRRTGGDPSRPGRDRRGGG